MCSDDYKVSLPRREQYLNIKKDLATSGAQGPSEIRRDWTRPGQTVSIDVWTRTPEEKLCL